MGRPKNEDFVRKASLVVATLLHPDKGTPFRAQRRSPSSQYVVYPCHRYHSGLSGDTIVSVRCS